MDHLQFNGHPFVNCRRLAYLPKKHHCETNKKKTQLIKVNGYHEGISDDMSKVDSPDF